MCYSIVSYGDFILLVDVRTEHIASAIGMVPPQDKFSRCTTTVFELDPHLIAVLKGHVSVVDKYNNYYLKLLRLAKRGGIAPPSEGGMDRKLQSFLIHVTRNPESLSEISMKFMTVPEVCVMMNDPLVLRSLKSELFVDFGLTLALKDALENKLTHLQCHLVEAIREAEYDDIFSSIVATLVYDERNILNQLVQQLLSRYENDALTEFKDELSVACHYLKREKCAAVLKGFDLIDELPRVFNLTKLEKLLTIFSMFPDRLSEEIKVILLKTPKAITYINDKVTLSQFNNKTLLKTVGEAGCNLDQEREADSVVTSLLYCMQHDLRYRELRPLLEVLLYQNLNVASDFTSVWRAMTVDVMHYKYLMSSQLMEYEELSGTYIMDGKEHSPYGHEGQDFALNFAVPLLLECGYPARKGLLEKALRNGFLENIQRKIKLHPEEMKYFRRYVDNPRTLSWSCCMALRRHYKGRAIHTFVESKNLPDIIAGQLLFKKVLKCV